MESRAWTRVGERVARGSLAREYEEAAQRVAMMRNIATGSSNDAELDDPATLFGVLQELGPEQDVVKRD